MSFASVPSILPPREFTELVDRLQLWLRSTLPPEELALSLNTIGATEKARLLQLLQRSGPAAVAADLERWWETLRDSIDDYLAAHREHEDDTVLGRLWQRVEAHGHSLIAWLEPQGHRSSAVALMPSASPAPVPPASPLPVPVSVAPPTRSRHRRTSGSSSWKVSVNPKEGTVILVCAGGKPHRATFPASKGFTIFCLLAKRPGRRYENSEILDEVWGRGEGPAEAIIDAHLSLFRGALKENGGIWMELAKRIKSRSRQKFLDLDG